jgi:hypothetical protein
MINFQTSSAPKLLRLQTFICVCLLLLTCCRPFKDREQNFIDFKGTSYDSSYIKIIDNDTIIFFQKFDVGTRSRREIAYSYHEFIAKSRDNLSRHRIDSLTNAFSEKFGRLTLVDSIPKANVYHFKYYLRRTESDHEIERWLVNSRGFDYVEPNYYYANQANQFQEAFDIEQWSMENRGFPYLGGGKADADMDGQEAIKYFNQHVSTDSKVIVAVIDGGAEVDHPSLASAIFTNVLEVPNNKIDDDHNGLIDDVHGWNFASNNNFLFDATGHGTHVAGIIGASPTISRKMRGVSPNASLLIVKTNESGLSSSMAIAKGIYYALDMNAAVINMSLGSYSYSQTMFNAVQNAVNTGVMVVAAAGNDGKDVLTSPTFPCSYANVVCVASTNRYDSLAENSNYQSGHPQNSPIIINIAAPGVQILSTVPGRQYNFKSGTSMASPQVAGAFALMKGLYPRLERDQLLRRLVESSDKLGSLNDRVVGTNRLNLYRTLVQPFQTVDELGVVYKDQIVNGTFRWAMLPYANSDDSTIMDGSSYERAFKISHIRQLVRMSAKDSDGHFRLTNNLDWEELPPWEQIMIQHSFKGTLHGDGYTIYNLKLNNNMGRCGLFRLIEKTGRVVNLRLASTNLQGTSNVGAIASNCLGTIDSVQVEGTVTASQDYIGGLVGVCNGCRINYSLFSGTLIGRSSIGGLAGQLSNSIITNNQFHGTIKGANNVGGLAGSSQETSFISNYVNGTIYGQKIVGGLAGIIYAGGISTSYVEGLVEASEEIAGGLIGELHYTKVYNCYSLAYVQPAKFSGGLLGNGRNFTVRSCYFVTPNDDGIGGIPTTESALREKSTFRGWWSQATPWSITEGLFPYLKNNAR